MPGAGAIKAGEAFVIIKALDQTQAVMRSIGKRLDSMASKILGLSKRMLAVGAAMAAPLLASINTFASFDDQIRKLGAVSAGTDAELSALRQQAMELGRTTASTASEVASLQVELGKLGFSRGEILKMTESIRNLAASTQDELPLAAELVGSSLRSFQLEASESTRVANLLGLTANQSANTLQTIADAMKYVGPIARQFNISIEDTMVILGALSNLNIKGETAGTAFRNMLIKASKEGKKFKEMLGIDVADEAGNLRPITDILFEMGRAIDQMGTAEKAVTMFELLGIRPLAGAAALSNTEAEFRRVAAAIKGGTKTVSQSSQEMESGIGGTFRRLFSALEGVRIAAGSALSESLQPYIEKLAGISTKTAEWIGKNKEVILAIAGISAGLIAGGAALLGFVLAIKIVAVAVGLATTAIGLLGAAINFMTAPLTVIPALLAVLGVSIIASMGEWQEFSTAAKNNFLTAWQAIINAIKSGDMESAWQIVITTLRLTWVNMLGTIAQAFQDFAQSLGWDDFIGGGRMQMLINGLRTSAALLGSELDRLKKATEGSNIPVPPGTPSRAALLARGQIQETGEVSSRVQQAVASVIASSIEGKQLGTIEAAKQAAENKLAENSTKQVGLLQDIKGELEDISDTLEESEGEFEGV